MQNITFVIIVTIYIVLIATMNLLKYMVLMRTKMIYYAVNIVLMIMNKYVHQ